MLIHEKHWWTEVIQPWLWTFSLKQAEFNLNNLRLGKSGKSRANNFSAMYNKINIRHYHTFGCLVYVLDARLQCASFIPKWDERMRVGAYVGLSPINAGNVSLVLNISTGHVQFHVVFDKTFSTVQRLKYGSVPASWNFICENNKELATYKYFNLADLWSKSERESGVKFNIQRDATKKSFQQRKDDALSNCDTDLRRGKSGKSRAKHFSAMHKKINIRHYHTFVCPVYVLNLHLQGSSFIPKWDEFVIVGVYVGRSPIHAENVSSY